MCDAACSSGAPASPPACYLICHNVSKKHNGASALLWGAREEHTADGGLAVGTLARCATAFGVAEVLLVGERNYNSFGAHGADAHVAFRHFPTLAQARPALACLLRSDTNATACKHRCASM
jgi:hypothetical protein